MPSRTAPVGKPPQPTVRFHAVRDRHGVVHALATSGRDDNGLYYTTGPGCERRLSNTAAMLTSFPVDCADCSGVTP